MAEPLRAPFANFVGAVPEEMREGYVRLAIATGPQHADRNGDVHTGVLTTVMDSVIGIALGTLRGGMRAEAYRPHATIEMSTSFYAQAAPSDEIVCEGHVIQLGERVAFGEVEARRRGDEQLIAKARLTFAIPPARE